MLQFCNIYNIVSKYRNFLIYGFVISKWMILSSLYVYELIYTTWSLCSFRKSKSLLETLVFPFPSLCPHPNQLLLWEERHDEEGETFVFISKEKKVLSSLLSRKNLLGTENVVILKFDSQKYILTIGIGSITYVEFWLDQQKDYML